MLGNFGVDWFLPAAAAAEHTHALEERVDGLSRLIHSDARGTRSPETYFEMETGRKEKKRKAGNLKAGRSAANGMKKTMEKQRRCEASELRTEDRITSPD